MTFDSRWKNPPGSDPKQLHLWAQDLIKELRKGDYQASITDAVSALSVAAFQSFALQVFTSDDTYTPTADMLFCLVISTGGGGGGGGADSDGSSDGGAAGGGAGGTCIELFTAAIIGAGQTVTIGAGGTAGANTGGNGGNGEDTTFGALHTAGGGPGGAGIAGTTDHVTSPTAGGTATGGLVNIPGGEGEGGIGEVSAAICISGCGGASFWGGGGASLKAITATAVAGRNGSAYGSGASGAANISTAAGAAGGVGAAGICVVIELIGGAA